MIHDLFSGLRVPDAERRMLGLFAHPDDEAFTCAGTLARIAARGGFVQLVCATRGELGEIGDPALATAETLGEVRAEELREACRQIGIGEPVFLGYRDSGMAGTPGNDDPRSLHRAGCDRVTADATAAIRRYRPQVVLTFDPEGGYGHPDHIAIHHAAMAAFDAAGDRAAFPEQVAEGLAPHRPTRLFYVALPRSLFTRLFAAIRTMGIDPAELGFRGGPLGMPDELIDAVIDVGDQIERKQAAMAAHRTQMAPSSPFNRIPRELFVEGMRREHFVLARGPGARAS